LQSPTLPPPGGFPPRPPKRYRKKRNPRKHLKSQRLPAQCYDMHPRPVDDWLRCKGRVCQYRRVSHKSDYVFVLGLAYCPVINRIQDCPSLQQLFLYRNTTNGSRFDDLSGLERLALLQCYPGVCMYIRLINCNLLAGKHLRAT
jgi:hypothetical protein